MRDGVTRDGAPRTCELRVVIWVLDRWEGMTCVRHSDRRVQIAGLRVECRKQVASGERKLWLLVIARLGILPTSPL